MNRRIAVALIAIAVGLGASANWARSQSPQSPAKLIIGVLSWPGIGPLYVGDELGFFKQEGIDLEVKLIESYDSRRAALAAGQIDIDHNTIDQLLIYAESKVDARAYGISDFSTGGDGIVVTNSIKSVADLRGKRVTFAEASPSELFLRFVLAQNRMPFSDIRPLPVADAQIAGTAVIANQVEAAVTYEPWLTKSGENKNLRILVSTKDYPKLIPGLFISTGKTIDGRRKDLTAFMRAWFRSVDEFYRNPDASKKIMQRRMNLSAEELDSVLGAIQIIGESGNKGAFNQTDTFSLTQIADITAQLWLEAGYVKSRFAPATMIHNLWTAGP